MEPTEQKEDVMSDKTKDAAEAAPAGECIANADGIDEVFEQLVYQLREWAKTVYNPSKIDRAIHIDKRKKWIHLVIFTDTNQYSIGVHAHDTVEKSYLGCTASCRKPRAGETWTRGNDLPDGDFTQETWDEIMTAIVRYEAQEVQAENWKERWDKKEEEQ